MNCSSPRVATPQLAALPPHSKPILVGSLRNGLLAYAPSYSSPHRCSVTKGPTAEKFLPHLRWCIIEASNYSREYPLANQNAYDIVAPSGRGSGLQLLPANKR